MSAPLDWRRGAHGWCARCGSEGQGEARVLPYLEGWAWIFDILPATDEPSIRSLATYPTADAAKAAVEAQAALWPDVVTGARRV